MPGSFQYRMFGNRRSAQLQALKGVAPHLTADQAARALDIALAMSASRDRLRAVCAVFANLTDADQHTALRALLAEDDSEESCNALALVARDVPPDALQLVLDHVRDTDAGPGRYNLALELAEALADPECPLHTERWNDSWRTLCTATATERTHLLVFLRRAAHPIATAVTTECVPALMNVLEDVRRWLR